MRDGSPGADSREHHQRGPVCRPLHLAEWVVRPAVGVEYLPERPNRWEWGGQGHGGLEYAAEHPRRQGPTRKGSGCGAACNL